MYTNADSLMNKLIEFKERVKMNCLVIGITWIFCVILVIYNWSHDGPHSLQLNVGENVFILRQSEGW